jgi:hypothetical protein
LTDLEKNTHDCLFYLFLKTGIEPGTNILEDTTYTFFQDAKTNIIYTLIVNDNTYSYLSIHSQDYAGTITLTRLADYSLEKSQLFWDLLEMGGIRQYSFNILLNKGIPDQSALEGIDWSEVSAR